MMAAARIWGIIVLTIAIFSLNLPAQAQYSGGTGEPNDPHQIATAEDLIALGEEPNDYDKHFILTADIDLDPNLPGRKIFDRAVIAPEVNDDESGFQGTEFTGVFDGNGYTISHLTIEGGGYLGLFGRTGYGAGASISNLGLEAVDVNGTSGFVGGLVGFNGGRITMSYSTGTVTGGNRVGGLAGENYRGSITLCYSTGLVTGYDCVGGLVGWHGGFDAITSSYSNCSVSGHNQVGGLVGAKVGQCSITDCYSTGMVNGNVRCHGLVGSGSSTSSFWDTETSGMTNSDGYSIGLPTAQMQNINTFLDAGWDFVGETVNGPNDVWSICEGTNYPRFVWQISPADFICPDGITLDDFYYFIDYLEDVNCDSSNGYCDGTDLDFSGTVDLYDLAIFVDYWLAEVQ